MISNKTISLDPNLWNSKKQSGTRKRKPKKNQSDLEQFDSQFNHQLNQLEKLNNASTSTKPSNPIKEPIYSSIKHGSKPTYKMLHNLEHSNTKKNVDKNLGVFPLKKIAKICIRGKKSRRKIKKYIKNLSNESLTDIKNHLYNNSLIRCGTAAPPDVLKEIYKNSKLTGNIQNTNGEILLHNFYQNPDSEL